MISKLAINILNAFVWGWIIALIALGLNLIFGLIHIINIAHGALYMLGAVFAWYFIQLTGNYWLAILIVPLILGIIGIGMERGVLRPIENKPILTIVGTFGIMLIFQQLVLMTFGGAAQRIPEPIHFRFPFFGLKYPLFRIVVAGFSIAMIMGLGAFLKWFKYGLWMRAVVQDREAALAMGIPVSKVYMWTFCLGTAFAGLSGVLAAPIVHVDFLMGLDMLISAFIVVIVGGLGSLKGSVAAAIIIAEIEGISCLWFTPTEARILALAFMVVVLLFRPEGLFGKKG